MSSSRLKSAPRDRGEAAGHGIPDAVYSQDALRPVCLSGLPNGQTHTYARTHGPKRTMDKGFATTSPYDSIFVLVGWTTAATILSRFRLSCHVWSGPHKMRIARSET